MDSLSGHFLIATPHMPDPRFRGQVIYLCAHNETGIMGLVVNNPSPEITLHDILLGANLPITEGPAAPVYLGGPVEPEAGFLLFTAEVPSRFAMQIQPGVFVSRDSRMTSQRAKARANSCSFWVMRVGGRASWSGNCKTTVGWWRRAMRISSFARRPASAGNGLPDSWASI